MIALDTSFLILLLQPGAKAPTDPNTGKSVTHSKERVQHFIAETTKSGERILLPTPALAEFLVGVKNRSDFITEIKVTHRLKIGVFDEMAAVEVALLTDGGKPGSKLDPTETRAKVKYDRQIVAIAKVNGAGTLCCDDNGLAELAKRNGLKVLRVWDLQLPPEDMQGKLGLNEPDAS